MANSHKHMRANATSLPRANKELRSYVERYVEIRREFVNDIKRYGVPWAPLSNRSGEDALRRRVQGLADCGLRVENDCKSLWLNWISPSCLACRRGVETETFLTSTQCNRNCFFCFNPNQNDYEYYLSHVNDAAQELKSRHSCNALYKHLGLSGGEPLLHKSQTLDFFRCASELYPQARLRLYTSGSGLDGVMLNELAAAGLTEIRFSIKLEEGSACVEDTLHKIEMCVGRIPAVMVEMPVMPNEVNQMKSLLKRLDSMGVTGINLLELCFPLHNSEEFNQRGYHLKAEPYRVLYGYWYGGGIPVDGSEAACIDLLEYALQEKIGMGVHYCSLENKLTGQIYQLNAPFAVRHRHWFFSQKDYFLKTIKFFGRDADTVEHLLRMTGEVRWGRDRSLGFVEVHPQALLPLASCMPNVVVGVAFAVMESRHGSFVLRELDVKPRVLGELSLSDL